MATETTATPVRARPEAAAVYAPPREPEAPAPVAEVPAGKEDAREASRWVVTTYFAEGLPFSLVHQVSAELFTAVGASLAAVGYTSLYGLAWNFKFLWSPLVARYGTLRRWIVAVELLMAAALAIGATRAGERDISFVAIALIFVAFLGATQDVAIDGYYLTALDKKAQASLSGARTAPYRIAMLVGKSGLVALAGWVSWRVSFLAAAAMMLGLAAIHRLLLRPLLGTEKAAQGTPAGTARAFLDSFRSYLQKPQIGLVLAFVLTFKAGDALLFNMSVPFLKDLGLDTQTRGLLSTPSLILSVAGATIGGVWIARSSLAKTLLPIAFLQAIAIPLYSGLAVLRPGFWGIAVAVGIEQFIAGLGNAAFSVFLMRQADGEHKVAHFAIGTALMSVPMTLVGLVSGHLAESLGFTRFFLVAFLLAVPGVLLARMVPKG